MFDDESIVETGKVISLNKDQARVIMQMRAECEGCGSMFCNINGKNEMQIDVINKIKATVGDTVEISIGGGALLNLSLLIYGVPILIAILSIVVGLNFIESVHKELISVGIACVLSTIYYFIFWAIGKRIKAQPKLPKITKVIETNS